MSVKRKIAHSVSATSLGLTLTACGLVTPDMKSPLQPLDTDALIVGVVGHVKSEVGCTVLALIKSDEDISKANNHPRNLTWIDTSIVKMTLNLTVEEKSSLAPGLSDTKVFPNSVTTFSKGGNVTNGQSFTLGLGGSLSSDATRKISSDYTFSVREDFIQHKAQYTDCKAYEGPLIGGDLKIADSFNGALTPVINNNPAKENFVTPGAPDTLQTEISFVVADSGSIGPAWKLVPISVNIGGTLATFGRTATDDVIITIGAKGQATDTAHNIAKAGSILTQAATSGM